MQSLHPYRGSIQEYLQELSDPDRYRPKHCPLCRTLSPLRAHGFYCRTVVDVQYDGSIRVRRYALRLFALDHVVPIPVSVPRFCKRILDQAGTRIK